MGKAGNILFRYPTKCCLILLPQTLILKDKYEIEDAEVKNRDEKISQFHVFLWISKYPKTLISISNK